MREYIALVDEDYYNSIPDKDVYLKTLKEAAIIGGKLTEEDKIVEVTPSHWFPHWLAERWDAEFKTPFLYLVEKDYLIKGLT